LVLIVWSASGGVYNLDRAIRYASLAVLTVGLTTLYRFSVGATVRARRLVPGAALRRRRRRRVAVWAGFVPGAVDRYTALHGAFAGLVIGMIGAYIAVHAVLLGAVLDAQLDES
jgi:uncharacterized BrkB/YihY/UPF0761 family membrane protein